MVKVTDDTLAVAVTPNPYSIGWFGLLQVISLILLAVKCYHVHQTRALFTISNVRGEEYHITETDKSKITGGVDPIPSNDDDKKFVYCGSPVTNPDSTTFNAYDARAMYDLELHLLGRGGIRALLTTALTSGGLLLLFSSFYAAYEDDTKRADWRNRWALMRVLIFAAKTAYVVSLGSLFISEFRITGEDGGTDVYHQSGIEGMVNRAQCSLFDDRFGPFTHALIKAAEDVSGPENVDVAALNALQADSPKTFWWDGVTAATTHQVFRLNFECNTGTALAATACGSTSDESACLPLGGASAATVNAQCNGQAKVFWKDLGTPGTMNRAEWGKDFGGRTGLVLAAFILYLIGEFPMSLMQYIPMVDQEAYQSY